MNSRKVLWAAAAITAAVVGCSGPSYEIAEVDGVVKVKGQPMKGLFLQFMPENGPTSIAETDDSGRFRLQYRDPKTNTMKDGAVVGKHRVVVMDAERPSVAQGEEPKPGRIPEKYSDMVKSPLTQEIRSGPQSIEVLID